MKSPLAYMGGKSRLVPVLVPIIEKTEHECYCEPFCGAAWVLFGKPQECSSCEVINDLDGELVSFWRCVQRHYLPLIDLFRHAVISREVFEWMKIERPETLTDLQRAARYYYLQRLTFGGKVKGRTFGYSATRPPNLDVDSIGDNLLAIHRRLSRVTVEHLDGLDCIRRYDRPGTLFFIDPPYFKTAGYEVDFPESVYLDLAAVLGKVKGRFLLTLNDHPAMRSTFRAFKISSTTTRYSVGTAESRKKVGEILISNF